MPLSEHEQRVLEQMEQALYAEDPRLASTLKSKPAPGAGLDRRRLAFGVLGALAGLGLVLVGVMTQQIWVGALGFLGMVLGGAWAATPGRKPASAPALGVVGGARRTAAPRQAGQGLPGQPRPHRTKRPRRPRSSGSFMQRMEEQWDKRREEGPF